MFPWCDTDIANEGEADLHPSPCSWTSELILGGQRWMYETRAWLSMLHHCCKIIEVGDRKVFGWIWNDTKTIPMISDFIAQKY